MSFVEKVFKNEFAFDPRKLDKWEDMYGLADSVKSLK